MKKINTKIKRKLRNRKKLQKVATNKFRISVSKSLNNLSAQIIDDKQKKTLVSVSSCEKEVKDNHEALDALGATVKSRDNESLAERVVANRETIINNLLKLQGIFEDKGT